MVLGSLSESPNLFQRGSLLDKYDDIYNMITEALIDPLSDPEKIFLAFLSPADEFTESMADFVTEVPDSDRFLKQMTEEQCLYHPASQAAIPASPYASVLCKQSFPAAAF